MSQGSTNKILICSDFSTCRKQDGQGCANFINSQHFCLHSSILQGKKARAEGWVPSRAGLGCSAVMMMSRNSLVTTSPVSTLMEPRVLGLKTVSPWMSRASWPDCWDHSISIVGHIFYEGPIIRLYPNMFVHHNNGYILEMTPRSWVLCWYLTIWHDNRIVFETLFVRFYLKSSHHNHGAGVQAFISALIMQKRKHTGEVLNKIE